MENRRKVLELFENNEANWKERAKEGIERNRKGEVKINLVDEAGNPLSNVKIAVKQTGHAFKFGANIFMLDELETPEKNEAYKKHFADLFNMATLPFYWGELEPKKGSPRYEKDSPKIYRRPAPDLCVEFCEKHGIEPREHALAYEHFFPEWLKDSPVEEIKREFERRCLEISTRYADKIPTIEVTNEMDWEKGTTAFYDASEYVEWCFKTARKYFPNNQLVINEWTPLIWEDRCRATDKYYAYIEANLLKGAPIDGIGMQFHMFYAKEEEYMRTRKSYSPASLYAHMDLYARFGKPLQLTELTVPAYSNEKEDEEIQARLIENLYRIWFSYPNMEQIIYWNLADGYAAFAPQGDMTSGENYYYGGLLRFDLTPKPAYYALKKLICEEWNTKENLTTDGQGKAEYRGFYGDYTLEITVDGKRYEKQIKVSPKKENVFTFCL